MNHEPDTDRAQPARRPRRIALLVGIFLALTALAVLTLERPARLVPGSPSACVKAEPRLVPSAPVGYPNEPLHITLAAQRGPGWSQRCLLTATLQAPPNLVVADPEQPVDPVGLSATWLVTPNQAGVYLATVRLRPRNCPTCDVVAANTVPVNVDEDRATTAAQANVDDIARSVGQPTTGLRHAIVAQRQTPTTLTFPIVEPVRVAGLRNVHVMIDSVVIPGSTPSGKEPLGTAPRDVSFQVVVTPPHHSDLREAVTITVTGTWRGTVLTARATRVVQVDVKEQRIAQLVSGHLEWIGGGAIAGILWLARRLWPRRKKARHAATSS